MQRRKRGSALPHGKLKARGHRSTVSGMRRFLSGKRAGVIADVLHQDAKRIMKQLRAVVPSEERAPLSDLSENSNG